MILKTTRIVALTALCAASISIAAVPAHATTPTAAPGTASTASAVHDSAPASTPLTPTLPGEPTSTNDEAVLKRLHALVGKQSPAELRRIERSGQPAQLLTDEHGKTVAGYVEEPKMTSYLSF